MLSWLLPDDDRVVGPFVWVRQHRNRAVKAGVWIGSSVLNPFNHQGDRVFFLLPEYRGKVAEGDSHAERRGFRSVLDAVWAHDE
jgi:hypothetical protein